jgi:crossover junction endodeoxyribonuclease RusA
MILTFSIPGVPQQQGSKINYGRVSVEANKKLKPWRAVALYAAGIAADPHLLPIFTGPVDVSARCYFPRPKSHYGTGKNAGVLKDTAPTWHSAPPDLDKLLRAIGDVLTQSQIIQDDRLIASWIGLKRYGTPRIDLIIQEADSA